MKRVFVVDSSHTIRAICKMGLENAGHQVLMAPTSTYALKQLSTLTPMPDIVLLGLRADSTDIDCAVLTMYLRRNLPHCRCILLVRSDVTRPQWTTTYEVIEAPFLIQKLVERINSPTPTQEVR